MKIDRRRFFALTASIAAAHCAAPPPAAAPVIAVDATDAGDSPPLPSSTPVATEGKEAPPPTEEGGRNATSPPSMAMGDSDSASKAVVTTKGQTCPPANNATGAPGSCASLKAPGPSCESFSDTKARCDGLKSFLKPRVAEKAVACHLAKSGSQAVCKFNLATECMISAMASVCIEPAAQTACKKVMAKCGAESWSKLTEDSCVAGVSSVADAGRASFVTCITEFCRFEPCVYGHAPTKEGGRNFLRPHH